MSLVAVIFGLYCDLLHLCLIPHLLFVNFVSCLAVQLFVSFLVPLAKEISISMGFQAPG